MPIELGKPSLITLLSVKVSKKHLLFSKSQVFISCDPFGWLTVLGNILACGAEFASHSPGKVD